MLTTAVAGATGKTGRFVVEELPSRGVQDGCYREIQPKKRGVPKRSQKLKIVVISRMNARLSQFGVDAAIYAQDFRIPRPKSSEKLKRCWDSASRRRRNNPLILLHYRRSQSKYQRQIWQKMTSPASTKADHVQSAGVTRPVLGCQKESKPPGCSDIPIVRLNPSEFLDVKRESEEKLRQS
jgi:hypothetical protein